MHLDLMSPKFYVWKLSGGILGGMKVIIEEIFVININRRHLSYVFTWNILINQ